MKFKARPPLGIAHAVDRAFRTEDAARAFFTDVRWRDGKFCPYCEHRKIYSLANGKTHKCASCRRCFTITVGTIFEGTKLPLQIWMLAIAHLCDHGGRLGSTGLAYRLGLSQKSAWYMLERLRQARLTLSFQKPLRDKKTSRQPSGEVLRKEAPVAPAHKRRNSSWFVYSGDKDQNTTVEKILNKLHAARQLAGGMGHPADAARAKMLFAPLIDEGYEINPGACYRWACQHNWEEDAAEELEEVIRKVKRKASK